MYTLLLALQQNCPCWLPPTFSHPETAEKAGKGGQQVASSRKHLPAFILADQATFRYLSNKCLDCPSKRVSVDRRDYSSQSNARQKAFLTNHQSLEGSADPVLSTDVKNVDNTVNILKYSLA